jgi:hypothetical protein
MVAFVKAVNALFAIERKIRSTGTAKSDKCRTPNPAIFEGRFGGRLYCRVDRIPIRLHKVHKALIRGRDEGFPFFPLFLFFDNREGFEVAEYGRRRREGAAAPYSSSYL